MRRKYPHCESEIFMHGAEYFTFKITLRNHAEVLYGIYQQYTIINISLMFVVDSFMVRGSCELYVGRVVELESPQ